MDVHFNHANKLIGIKILEYGEQHGLLSNEQFGSRRNKSASEHADFVDKLIQGYRDTLISKWSCVSSSDSM